GHVVKQVGGEGDGGGELSGGGGRTRPGGPGPPSEGRMQPGGSGGEDQRHGQQQGEGDQARSSLRASQAVPPSWVCMRAVSTCSTRTASSTSAVTPRSTMSGTPAAMRNASAAMPLSIISTATICDRARRRVTSVKNAIRTTASAAGAARPAGVG